MATEAVDEKGALQPERKSEEQYLEVVAERQMATETLDSMASKLERTSMRSAKVAVSTLRRSMVESCEAVIAPLPKAPKRAKDIGNAALKGMIDRDSFSTTHSQQPIENSSPRLGSCSRPQWRQSRADRSQLALPQLQSQANRSRLTVLQRGT